MPLTFRTPAAVASRVTVGIDIGTTALKAVAADDDGRVVARVRMPQDLRTPSAGRLEHDAASAWRVSPREALSGLAERLPGRTQVKAVAVSAMTPTLTAVDREGVPLGPGVLYDDERGRPGFLDGLAASSGDAAADPIASGEMGQLLRWYSTEMPHAEGFWPAQAVANHGLGGEAAIDYATAFSFGDLFDGSGWDAARVAACGARVASLPRVAMMGDAIGLLDDPPSDWAREKVVLGAGAVDALCEQLLAGATQVGDVLVVVGSTLVVWVVAGEWRAVDGCWTVPGLMPGQAMIGGPSNAGGLWLDWVDRIVAPDDGRPVAADRVPRWQPWLRGERVPHHQPSWRASLDGLDVTAGPGALRRAAFEASAFAARSILERVGTPAGRVIVTGGGVRRRAWLQALADVLGVPVETVATPEGSALGAAFLARLAAGWESSMNDAVRWASAGFRIDPRPSWVGPAAERYQRWLAEQPH